MSVPMSVKTRFCSVGGLQTGDIPQIKLEAVDKIKISALKMMSKEQVKV